MHLRRLLTICGLALTAGCATAPHDALAGQDPARSLVSGWDSESRERFEARVDALATAPAGAWDAGALAALTAGLAGQDERATRAVVLLAHDPSSAATERLLGRLELRTPSRSRAFDAPDVVAARALAGRALGAPGAARLSVLAIGPDPHPVLDVRVECAAAALAAGRDEVAPFLVRVLRARTPAEREDPGDWEPVTTLAWPKSRAAEALARRTGLPQDFRPDGSWRHQMDAAQRFADALEF